MKQSLGLVSLVVRDYDEALAFFVGTLGFVVVEDSFVLEQSKLWVVVALPSANESRLLLARASTSYQQLGIGSQTGDRVFLFLYTDNFPRDYDLYRTRDVGAGFNHVRVSPRMVYVDGNRPGTCGRYHAQDLHPTLCDFIRR